MGTGTPHQLPSCPAASLRWHSGHFTSFYLKKNILCFIFQVFTSKMWKWNYIRKISTLIKEVTVSLTNAFLKKRNSCKLCFLPKFCSFVVYLTLNFQMWCWNKVRVQNSKILFQTCTHSYTHIHTPHQIDLYAVTLKIYFLKRFLPMSFSKHF